MRYHKSKWKASAKDTWSVERTLNKIILAHLAKLYECLSNSKCAGVPMHYVELQGALDGLTDTWEADVDRAHLLRMKDLEELIWVFGSNEPNISNYNFHIEMVCGDVKENGNTPVTFAITGVNGKDGESERNRYHEDMKAYDRRKKDGYKLFGQIYEFLDW